MRILLILAGLTLSLAAASQEIWRWVDKNGTVHFSDQPGAPNAELITVLEPNASDSGSGDEESSAAVATVGSAPEEAPDVLPYDQLSIVSPPPDEVFFGSDATVSVQAELQGTLRPDHSVVFFLNGNRRPADGLSMELSGLARGTYFLRASILDQRGNAVISSQQTTFHVRQPSIRSPQSPQAPPRPTPRPTPRPATP
jgi:hypothetical protein